MTANPYQYNTPISYAGRFAGRHEAFTFMQTHLSGGPQKSALVILGPHQIGKSSVLRRLSSHLDHHYVPVRLSLRANTVAGEKAWLSALAETVPKALQAADIQSARLPDLPAHPADLREALEGDYLREGLRSLRRDRHLLILVDNAERLLTAVKGRGLPRDTFKFLAGLLEAHDHFDMVMAFDSRYEPELLSVGRPFDPALFYRLGTLPHEELRLLIDSPLPDGLTYQPEAIDTIYDLTAGHPYLAQLMCWLLYERSDHRHHTLPITVEDVEAVTDTVLAMGGETLGAVWRSGSPQEQLVLTALSVLSPEEPPQPVPHEDVTAWLIAADRPLDPRTVNATWRRLEYERVLTLSAEGKLLVNGGLQRRWLRDHVTLPEAESSGPPWRRVALIVALAVAVLALIFVVLSTLPGPATPTVGDAEATITLDLGLQATGESYNATQTATVR